MVQSMAFQTRKQRLYFGALHKYNLKR